MEPLTHSQLGLARIIIHSASADASADVSADMSADIFDPCSV